MIPASYFEIDVLTAEVAGAVVAYEDRDVVELINDRTRLFGSAARSLLENPRPFAPVVGCVAALHNVETRSAVAR